jgi:cytochrome b561
VWRIRNGLPQPVRPFSKFEHAASKAVHWLLLICIVVMPITGMIYSGASGYGLGIFGFEFFPTHYGADGQAVPFNAKLSDLGQSLHGYIGYFLLALIMVHLAGALKHHFSDKDRTLKRMLGFATGEADSPRLD